MNNKISFVVSQCQRFDRECGRDKADAFARQHGYASAEDLLGTAMRQQARKTGVVYARSATQRVAA